VRETADAMVSSGMKAVGYQYIVIDDGWQGERDAKGRLQANSKFPDMKALADYVHSKGLKIGLWATPGPQACSPNYPGSYGHEKEDAEQWAEWGMDYIKFDWCSAGGIYSREQQPLVYQKQAEILRATGRPMLFSICQYGDSNVMQWGAAAGGNMWRTTFDIQDNWQSVSSIGFRQSQMADFAGPGHWNDPDMLEVGNGGMSGTEYRTHFSLWAMAAAPLIAGNDLRDMDGDTKSILMNAEVIAIDQDRLGKPGRRVLGAGETEVWSKPLADGAIAVALFNKGTVEASVSAAWSDLNLTGSWKVRDLWAHQDLAPAAGLVKAAVSPHGVVMLRLSK
jgi:alpha-galactosidase